MILIASPLKTPQIVSSTYRIYIQKSELMPVGDGVSLSSLGSVPFKISPKKFKYLGVSVAHNYKDLYVAN